MDAAVGYLETTMSARGRAHYKRDGKVTKFKLDVSLRLKLQGGGGVGPHGVAAHGKRGEISNVHSSPTLPLDWFTTRSFSARTTCAA